MHIFPRSESGWTPIVSTASSTKNIGIDHVWDKISEYKEEVLENGYFYKNRDHQQIQWMYNNINEELKRLLYTSEPIKEHLAIFEKEIITSKVSPVKAAQMIIEEFKKSFTKDQ